MKGHYADVSRALGTEMGHCLVCVCQKLNLQWPQGLHISLILHNAYLYKHMKMLSLVITLHYQSFHGERFKENKPKHCQHLVFSLVQFSCGGQKRPFFCGMKGVGRFKSGDTVPASVPGRSKE